MEPEPEQSQLMNSLAFVPEELKPHEALEARDVSQHIAEVHKIRDEFRATLRNRCQQLIDTTINESDEIKSHIVDELRCLFAMAALTVECPKDDCDQSVSSIDFHKPVTSGAVGRWIFRHGKTTHGILASKLKHLKVIFSALPGRQRQ